MQCATYDKNGKIISKTAYDSRVEAKRECRRLIKKFKQYKFFWNIYKCKVCKKYHIGKNNFKII